MSTAQESRRRFLRKALAGTALTCATVAFGQTVAPPVQAATTGVDDFAYLIYMNGSTIYALNGSTGSVDFSGPDAATVIQNAINSAAVGSLISIKPGIYMINSTINITKALRIVGSGVTSAGTTFQNNFNGTMFLVTHGYARIEGITCQGTNHQPSYTGDYGIKISGVNNVVIKGVQFSAHYNDLVFSGTCFYCTVEDCEWYSAVNELISTDSTTNVNVHITDCYGFVNSATNGFNLQGVNSVMLENVEISGKFFGPVLALDRYNGGVFIAVNCMFENTYDPGPPAHNADRAIWIKGSSAAPLQFAYFNNCYFAGGNYSASPPPPSLPVIQVDYATVLQFDGGDIVSPQGQSLGYRGMIITGAVHQLQVRNMSWNVNSSGIAANAGATIDGMIVQGNRYNLMGDYLVNFSLLQASSFTAPGIFTHNDLTTSLGFFLPSGAPVLVKDNPGFNSIAKSASLSLSVTEATTKAGVPVDTDFTNPRDGLVVVDSTNNKIWVRVGGVWRGVPVT